MTPDRKEQIRANHRKRCDRWYRKLPCEKCELLKALDDAENTLQEIGKVFEAFCPPEEAAALRERAKRAKKVVEAARPCVETFGPGMQVKVDRSWGDAEGAYIVAFEEYERLDELDEALRAYDASVGA